MDEKEEILKYKDLAFKLTETFMDTYEDRPNDSIVQSIMSARNGLCQMLIIMPLGNFDMAPIALWEMDVSQIGNAFFTVLNFPQPDEITEDVFCLAHFIEYELMSFHAFESSKAIQFSALVGQVPRWVSVYDTLMN